MKKLFIFLLLFLNKKYINIIVVSSTSHHHQYIVYIFYLTLACPYLLFPEIKEVASASQSGSHEGLPFVRPESFGSERSLCSSSSSSIGSLSPLGYLCGAKQSRVEGTSGALKEADLDPNSKQTVSIFLIEGDGISQQVGSRIPHRMHCTLLQPKSSYSSS